MSLLFSETYCARTEGAQPQRQSEWSSVFPLDYSASQIIKNLHVNTTRRIGCSAPLSLGNSSKGCETEVYLGTCSFTCAPERLVTTLCPGSEPAYSWCPGKDPALSADNSCLLSRVGVVTADKLSGELIQARKNSLRSTTLKPKTSSQENVLWHPIAPTILYHSSKLFKLFSYQEIGCVNNLGGFTRKLHCSKF